MLALATMLTAFVAWAIMGDDGTSTDTDIEEDEVLDGVVSPQTSVSPVQDMLDFLGEEEESATAAEPIETQPVSQDTIAGTESDDVILVDDGASLVEGQGGDDILIGAEDSATLDGGSGDDIVTGVHAAEDQASEITELVGTAAHHLYGGAGDDSIMGGAGDSLNGGAGRDVFFVDGTLAEDAAPAMIEDFEPPQDSIVICIPTAEADLDETWPERPEFSGEVSVTANDSTAQYEVRVNGSIVALVTSKTGLDASSVSVAMDGHVGPSLFDIEHGYV